MDIKKIKEILEEFNPEFIEHMNAEMAFRVDYDMATIDWDDDGMSGKFKPNFQRILAVLIGLTEKKLNSPTKPKTK